MPSFKNYVLDLLFPRRCLGCNVLLTDEFGHYACGVCLRGIKFQNTFACAFCASPVARGSTCPYCRRNHSLDRLLVVTSYENRITKQILKNAKYRFVKTLAEQIGRLMANYLKKQISWLSIEKTLLIPVPLHPSRLRWRGFNHAEIMAKVIGQELGLEICTDALARFKKHRPQADIKNRESRIANISIGTFRCVKPAAVACQKIILVDDLSTTGSTLNDCAYALKGTGAKEVIGFVFARGKSKKT